MTIFEEREAKPAPYNPGGGGGTICIFKGEFGEYFKVKGTMNGKSYEYDGQIVNTGDSDSTEIKLDVSVPGELIVIKAENYEGFLQISGQNISYAAARVTKNDEYAYKSMVDSIKEFINQSQTITHYAPVEGDIKDFVVGVPVFMSGKVYNRINESWIESKVNDRQDCICSVMISGNEKNYVGVIVGVDEKNKSITFASHGDFMFNVDNSSSYEVGDVVLYDGRILDENVTLTLKLQQSIVGKITSIIDENTVAIFRD